MDNTHELFDSRLADLIEDAANFDLASGDATTAMKNLKIFSECRPPEPTPEPEPAPELNTFWEKTRFHVASVLDNETTRVIIKAGGAFAGIALVAYSTIHKDHVMERQALAQANQRLG